MRKKKRVWRKKNAMLERGRRETEKKSSYEKVERGG